MRIAILGSGPAGLMSAHAAASYGAQVAIFGNLQPSTLHGAQYLHQPIPDVDCGVETAVTYYLRGDIDGYRTKVYDDLDPEFVSPEKLTGVHSAWDIRQAYRSLWGKWGHLVNPFWINNGQEFNANYGDSFLEYFDVVVSTIPRRLMCINPDHEFVATHIWAAGDAPEIGQFCPVQAADEGQIICNGNKTPSWYRVSKIYGYTTCEWPVAKQPPFEGVGKVTKPVRTTCNCFPSVLHTGRYGSWRKGYLAHQAYDDTKERIKTVLRDGDQLLLAIQDGSIFG